MYKVYYNIDIYNIYIKYYKTLMYFLYVCCWLDHEHHSMSWETQVTYNEEYLKPGSGRMMFQ